MCTLHSPAICFIPRYLYRRNDLSPLGLLHWNVSRIVLLFHSGTYRRGDVPLAATKVSRLPLGWFRSINRNRSQCRFDQIQVWYIGSCNLQPKWYTLPISEKRLFCADLCSIRRVFARLFFSRGELWSCSHLNSAIPSQSPVLHRIRVMWLFTCGGKVFVSAKPESDDEDCYPNQTLAVHFPVATRVKHVEDAIKNLTVGKRSRPPFRERRTLGKSG